MTRILFPLCLCFIFFFAACSKEDDSSSGGAITNPPGTGDTAFSWNMDGTAFESNPLLVAGTSASSAGLTTRLASGTVISNGDTTTVAITMTAFDSSSFAVGATFDAFNNVLGNWCFGVVTVNSGGSSSEYEAFSTAGNLPASATITSYDEDNETFSGTFSFEAYDDVTDVTKVVSNGVFSNVEFD
jgi:hypothetical protein